MPKTALPSPLASAMRRVRCVARQSGLRMDGDDVVLPNGGRFHPEGAAGGLALFVADLHGVRVLFAVHPTRAGQHLLHALELAKEEAEANADA